MSDWMYHVKSNTLQKRLFTDLEKGIYTDVMFLVGPTNNQRTFRAHRLVLGAENFEFEKILNGVDELEKIKLPDVHPKGFENLIRHCYGANLRFFQDLSAIRDTYLAAQKFKVHKLKELAENQLGRLLKPESVEEILKISKELHMPRIEERCLGIIASGLERVLMTEKLASASTEVMEFILGLLPNRGFEFRACALVSLLQWMKKQNCSDEDTRRLLSIVLKDDVASSAVSFYESKSKLLTESHIQEIKKVFSKSLRSYDLSSSMGSTDTVEKTVVPPEGVIAKDDALEVEQKPSQEEEIIVDQETVLELKDEVVTDSEEVSELKGEKEGDKDGDSDFDDGPVLGEKIIQELKHQAATLFQQCVSTSAKDAEDGMASAIAEVLTHASDTLQETMDAMLETSTKLLSSSTPKKQVAEITTADLTEQRSEEPSFTAEDESERKIKDV